MHWKNTATRYGLVAIVLHWVIAVTVIGLAILGLWMVDLSYYSPYYRSAPFWHKSIGLALFAVLVLRILWRLFTPRPAHLPNHRSEEHTSELQSRPHLVCRLLLEKKKNKKHKY